VPAHVLADGDQLTAGAEQPGGVQPAGTGEHPLRAAQPVRQRGQHVRREPCRVRGQRGGRQDADVLDARLPADTARAGGHEVTPGARRHGNARGQGHVGDGAHPVVAGVTAGGPVAELDLGDVRR
jgi:hypothetical protein